MDRRTLMINDHGPDVADLQKLLKAHGYDPGPADGVLGHYTLDALQEFQGSHLGPDGIPLSTDGVVTSAVWWALEHPTGDDQRSGIPGTIPRGLTPFRRAVLELAVIKHAEGVHEVPDGSNGGDGVDEITGGRRVPWCALYVSWVIGHARCEYMGQRVSYIPFDRNQAAVINIWRIARDKGWWLPKEKVSVARPVIPGDLFIMLYRRRDGKLTGKGHVGFVLRVAESLSSFNTNEGNCGNRVKHGLRSLGQGSLEGFVNFYGPDEQPVAWERGIIPAKKVDREGTR